ncbi:5-oxoprolinase subunit PxpB [Paraburkholderia silvatlantica]|uniref:KipI family sensor histidine kinase inhibitor n=1 Tax=Paraburkholderia silvatlantica TaxID=321895 RepID=A0A2U1A9R7_9BURK|nr:5-oxoprolinase subunit PxpB [Paraburkholderia silvatlantica]MBB2930540.1 KipI family sensor histidine kinase inhibitor [Paraburkholderia silvatlantica]PVY30344.1 KipI family sensor histidine kinase inhibitor [Paraburkholderia silvatlantica]PXW36919.1 KipI family sensor histidine kinase inhibitor [Paraburkholderia silvatlantica]PYE21259.1 KipI family sensor histidine kinase inhibitor [Paraburkholderia silvatlantica]TDQ86600.1 KipI family sensor histidine kinase inhibitor [Paraburkholderia si
MSAATLMTRPEAQHVAPTWQVAHSGESLVIVEIHVADRSAANRLTRVFAARVASENLPYVRDIVPAMTTLGVHYAPHLVERDRTDVLPHRIVEERLKALLADAATGSESAPRVIEIPVCYGGEQGPDLDEVADKCGLSAAEVVRLHRATLADVMMIGFAPGHPYIGMLDSALAIPRRATPRTAVPPGSIGLANCQSVIYPVTLPGGWNLIGRTPLQMFDPARAEPCLLRAGDQVRFVSITAAEFDALNEHVGVTP